MLTIKIVNVITKDEFLVEAAQCIVEKDTAESFENWEQEIFKQELGKLVITSPDKDEKNITFRCIKALIDDVWCVYYTCDSNVFVMNEHGQTVAIYRK